MIGLFNECFPPVMDGVSMTVSNLAKNLHEQDVSKTVRSSGASSIYAAAYLMLFPSLYDNAPVVIREGAALLTPSLVVRNFNTAGVIFNCYNGFIADNNVDSYSSRLSMLLQRPKLIRHAGDMASRTLVRSWADISEEVADRYMHLIARKQRKIV